MLSKTPYATQKERLFYFAIHAMKSLDAEFDEELLGGIATRYRPLRLRIKRESRTLGRMVLQYVDDHISPEMDLRQVDMGVCHVFKSLVRRRADELVADGRTIKVRELRQRIVEFSFTHSTSLIQDINQLDL